MVEQIFRLNPFPINENKWHTVCSVSYNEMAASTCCCSVSIDNKKLYLTIGVY